MKKIYSLLCLFSCAFILPLPVYAEETHKTPSWEGVYCNEATSHCIKIFDQVVEDPEDSESNGDGYAQIMFYNEKKNIYIAETELALNDGHKASIFLLNLTLSEDRKEINAVVTHYFKSWGDDDINNYGDALLFGKYIRKQ